jgi:ubiquinone/menaquinone biosynthesis C-methylase UbiE
MYSTNNYDIIARWYDFMSRLVFRQTQVRAQVELLTYLDDGARILVVGGGTGWILDALGARRPSGLRITYVEISANMLALAQKRDWGKNEAVFVHAPIEQFAGGPAPAAPLGGHFDSILTGFLFDNFSPGRAAQVFRQLDALLRPGGAWLFTDFFYQKGRGPFWQRLLMKAMYLFFRLVCRVEAKRLTDMAPYFEEAGYRETCSAFYYGGLIRAAAYRKSR